MTAFAKKNSIKTPIKHWLQKKFRSQNERNAKKSTFLTQKSTKTTAYSIKNRKRSKLRSAGELTVCASSRWSPRKTPKNGSEAKKKTKLAAHDVSKSYKYTTSHKYVAKPESQQRRELHIRTLETATTCSPSASVPLEQSINTFCERNIKRTEFNIWHGRVFTLHLSKKIQKLIEKHVRVDRKTQFTAT